MGAVFEWGTVSTASMAGMVFSLVISVGLPIVLAVLICRKMKGQLMTLFVGASIFILFAMVLEQLLHAVVLSSAGTLVTSTLIGYALYGGLAAALFEETGRYFGMRYFMKHTLNRENALMYGVGHGGIEAIMLMGTNAVNNLLTSTMINNGSITEAMAQLDAETAGLAYEQLQTLWQTPAYLFYLGGIERVSAITLQIGLSLFMFRAVKNGRRNCLFLAFGIHFLVDFLTVLISRLLPTLLVEAVLIVGSAAVLWYAFRTCWEEKQA